MGFAPHRRAALLLLLGGGAVLGAALASEAWAGLVPCPLCLLERWPWRVVIVLGGLALVLPRGLALPVLGLALLALLGGLVLSIVHVGVEQGFWPSPLPECAAPRLPAGSLAEQLRAMPAAPSKACDMPTQLLPFLPSMAALNGIASAVIAALALLLARRPQRHRLRRHRAWERRR